RNLPWRATPTIVSPARAETGGSKVFSAWKPGTSSRSTTRPPRRASRSAASAWTSGSSGIVRSYGRWRASAPFVLADPVAGAGLRHVPGAAGDQLPLGTDLRGVRVAVHTQVE